nr:MAG TPA: helix-turn-helix domain protein [Herelleviridae sp.]
MAAELNISVHQLAGIEEGRKAVSLPLAKKIAEYFKALNASEES